MATWSETRTYGVEIECIAGNLGLHGVADAIRRAGIECQVEGWQPHGARSYRTWKVTTDGSLSPGGVEVVSPPLAGLAGLEEIKRVAEALRVANCTVDMTCGLHVHAAASDFRPQDFEKVIRYYQFFEPVIDQGVAPSRRGSPRWCATLRGINPEAPDIRAGRMNMGRYFKINLNAYAAHGTLEFRQHQGSLSPEKITNWVVLTGAIMETARKGRTCKYTAGKVARGAKATWAYMRNSILVNRGGRFSETPTFKALEWFEGRIREFKAKERTPRRAA